jgi:hypothetical protein
MNKKDEKTISRLIFCCLALMLLPGFATAGGNETDLPVKEVGQLHQYITEKNPYTGWKLWPGTTKLYPGKQPHGAFLTTYVNNIALKSLNEGDKKFPQGSIIVKENYTAAKELAAITVMYKVDGYNPLTGDWYWLKFKTDGSVEAEGAVTSCIGCHSAMVDKDWVFTDKP